MIKSKVPARKAKSAAAKARSRVRFSDWDAPKITGLLVLADGTVIEARVSAPRGQPRAKCVSTPP